MNDPLRDAVLRAKAVQEDIDRILGETPEAVSVERPMEKTAGAKTRVTIWLDTDTVERFRSTGRDWHVRIRDALREHLDKRGS